MYCEPYQSCSLFGALRMIANIKNVVSIVHGPSGCSFYARNSIIRLNGYYSAKERVPIPKIFSTDFNENDAIFGGKDKLEAAINEIVDQEVPEAIFIFNCCVSEIIGEDIDSVSENATHKHSIPVIPVHCAGFKGDHKVGMKIANDILFDLMKSQECKKDPNRVNILGDFDYFNRSSIELSTIIESIPNKKCYHIPGNSSIDSIKQSPGAALNIVTCGNASKYLAQKMQVEYGIPYIGGDAGLYGISSTYLTYKKIFNFFGEKTTSLDELYNQTKHKVLPLLEKLNDCRAVVVAGTRRARGYSQLLTELGINVEFIFTESIDEDIRSELLKYTPNIMCDEYPVGLSRMIDTIKPDFVFSTLPELVAPNKYVYRKDEDYSGFRGALDLAEYLTQLKKEHESTSFIRMEN